MRRFAITDMSPLWPPGYSRERLTDLPFATWAILLESFVRACAPLLTAGLSFCLCLACLRVAA